MWILMVAMLLSLPLATYFAPSFAPFWMKIMPTYYMLFAYKEASFPTGNPTIIYQTMLICSGIGVVAHGLALMRYKHSFAVK